MIAELSTVVSRRSRADVYFQVLRALVLRDMRTRFSGSHLGYAVAVLWPVAHVFVLIVILTYRNLPSPMGGGTPIFVATGAVPCLGFMYISREVMKGYAANKPLTYYPQVKIFDVILARVIVEVASGFIGVMAVCTLLALFGVNPVPADAHMAFTAYIAALLLGIGFGVCNVGIVAFFPAWQIGYVFFTILNYMVAGVMFMPNYLPSEIYNYLRFNPMTQIIEWMRIAYEPTLAIEIDYLYIFVWIIGSMMVGFLMERFVVRKMT